MAAVKEVSLTGVTAAPVRPSEMDLRGTALECLQQSSIMGAVQGPDDSSWNTLRAIQGTGDIFHFSLSCCEDLIHQHFISLPKAPVFFSIHFISYKMYEKACVRDVTCPETC